MNGEVQHRLDLAQLDARRRKHAQTEPEHLLAVILGITDESEKIYIRGLDPAELRERIDAHFAERPAVGGYRDGVAPPASAALERVLRRVQGNRWLPFLDKMPMLDSLFLEPSIAQLVFALRRGDDSRHIIERARALATLSKHENLGLEHVMRSLLDLPSFVDTLARAGGDAQRLRSTLDTVLSPAHPTVTALSNVAAPLRRVLYGGAIPDADATPMTIRQLCMALARENDCDRFWEAAGVTRATFILAVHVPS